jgi:phosphoglycolate phosphatase-like HAD superfamily hydrolase
MAEPLQESQGDQREAIPSPDAFVFDLDQTLVDSTSAAALRKARNWSSVYQAIPSFRLYSGVSQLLRLIGSCPIAVVTSSPRTYAERVLDHFQIEADVLVCYHDTKLHKPDPAPIQLAIERLGMSDKWRSMADHIASKGSGRRPRIWGVGDHPHDIRAAKAANIVSVGAAWGCEDLSALQAAGPAIIFMDAEGMCIQISASSKEG